LGRGIAPPILNLVTRWMWVVSFTFRRKNLNTHWKGICRMARFKQIYRQR